MRNVINSYFCDSFLLKNEFVLSHCSYIVLDLKKSCSVLYYEIHVRCKGFYKHLSWPPRWKAWFVRSSFILSAYHFVCKSLRRQVQLLGGYKGRVGELTSNSWCGRHIHYAEISGPWQLFKTQKRVLLYSQLYCSASEKNTIRYRIRLKNLKTWPQMTQWFCSSKLTDMQA